MRIVDADNGRGGIAGRIVNQFPVIFRHGNEAVVVSVKCQVNRLLDAIHIRQCQNVERPRVNC